MVKSECDATPLSIIAIFIPSPVNPAAHAWDAFISSIPQLVTEVEDLVTEDEETFDILTI
ncbi:hypothetical protein [Clostridium sp.]|uniref:hypothetical protein n=1 Tax=Clostridium sp. TaxID=1506 RepID=UPI002FDDC23B